VRAHPVQPVGDLHSQAMWRTRFVCVTVAARVVRAGRRSLVAGVLRLAHRCGPKCYDCGVVVSGRVVLLLTTRDRVMPTPSHACC
jgi:hypothetical protein